MNWLWNEEKTHLLNIDRAEWFELVECLPDDNIPIGHWAVRVSFPGDVFVLKSGTRDACLEYLTLNQPRPR